MIAGGDIVGRDKIIHHHGPSEERLLALFTQSQRRLLEDAQKVGLHTSTIIELARRLKPDVLDPDQAVVELTRAVEIALDVIVRGERGSNEDAFVNAVLAEVAAKTRNNDLDGGAKAIADALAEIDRRDTAHRETVQRERIALLDAGIKQHTLRRDAVAVAAQIERSVAVQHATERPAWHPAFRARYDEYREDGAAKGINFSLEVAIECARRMVDTAGDVKERGMAAHLLGTRSDARGTRERHGAARGGGQRLSQRAAGKDARARAAPLGEDAEQPRQRASDARGTRERHGAAGEAVNAYRDALQE